MELTLDKFGRILIPKDIREELGLQPGASLHVEKIKNGLKLNKLDYTQSLVKKGNTLIFIGKFVRDVEEIINDIRNERDEVNWGKKE